jgi:hypothetical protein
LFNVNAKAESLKRVLDTSILNGPRGAPFRREENLIVETKRRIL